LNQAWEAGPANAEVTDEAARAAVGIIAESDMLECEKLADEHLMHYVLVGTLSCGEMRIHINSQFSYSFSICKE
jgi:hypothetical protein